jgi:hypothetical protein
MIGARAEVLSCLPGLVLRPATLEVPFPILVAPREPKLGPVAQLVTPNFDGMAVEADRLDYIIFWLHFAFPSAGEEAIVYKFFSMLVLHFGKNGIGVLTRT